MSFLMVEQLENNDPISFELKMFNSSQITSVRLGLYRKGLVDGDLTVRIYNMDDDLLGTAIMSAEMMGEIPGPYFHGMVDIPLEKSLEINLVQNIITLRIEIEINNYVNSDSNYLALVREPNPNYPVNHIFAAPTGIVEEDIWLSPFAIELFSYRG